MATLTCRVCGRTLTLFGIHEKKRKGTVRCTGCGAKISYDLSSRAIQKSGFWAKKTPAFDSRIRQRLLRQAAGKPGTLQKRTGLSQGSNPFQAKAGFASFDRRSGKLIPKGHP